MCTNQFHVSILWPTFARIWNSFIGTSLSFDSFQFSDKISELNSIFWNSFQTSLQKNNSKAEKNPKFFNFRIYTCQSNLQKIEISPQNYTSRFENTHPTFSSAPPPRPKNRNKNRAYSKMKKPGKWHRKLQRATHTKAYDTRKR